MRRLPVPELSEGGGTVRVEGAARHYGRVLRLERGTSVVLFDGRGNEAQAVLREWDEHALVFDAKPRARAVDADLRITLVQALVTSDKVDAIVRATTEVGVAAIHWVVAERSIAKLEASKRAAKLERWARIATEAARQCGRADVPVVDVCASWTEAFEAEDGQRYVASPRALSERPLERGDVGKRAVVAVGPEGGFSDAEAKEFDALGAALLVLPTNVLRVETAAPVTVALLRAAASAWWPLANEGRS